MKIGIKNIWTGTLGIFLATLASCSTDNEGTMYTPGNNEAVFAANSATYLFGTSDVEEYTVTVKRSSSVGAAEVPVTNEVGSGTFSIPEFVSFEDGSFESSLTITFSREDLEKGQSNEIRLSLPESDIASYQTEMTVSITRDFTWELYAKGTYTSGFFKGEEIPADLFRCVENPEQYRIMAPFEDGYNLQFSVAEDGSVSYPSLNSYGGYEFTTGYLHPNYGMVYQEYYPEDTTFDADKKQMTFIVYSFVDAGGFGYMKDSFTWE